LSASGTLRAYDESSLWSVRFNLG